VYCLPSGRWAMDKTIIFNNNKISYRVVIVMHTDDKGGAT
jgi:hypothetical protein